MTLHGHTSPETAYVVADYPYGFRLRCSIRYWIETKKGFGQRVMSQTTNPKKGDGTSWNKPKGSTYSPIKVLFIDPSTGHVENNGLSVYATTAQIAGFEAAYSEALTGDYEQHALRMLRVVAARVEARQAASEAAAAAHNGEPVVG